MSEQRKRLIRSKKQSPEEKTPPVQEVNTAIPTPQPVQPPQQIQPPEPVQEPRPKSKRDVLFAEDTQTCNVSLEDIKAGQLRVFVEDELEELIIKLPKPLALAMRMAYRQGLNANKQPQIITTQQTNEEEFVIKAAEAMGDYLRRLGHCHGKVEQDLLQAIKILKEARRNPPKLGE